MSVRTEGYVIRWRAGYADTDVWKYHGGRGLSTFEHASILTLREASEIVGGYNLPREIVRVRRVEGADRWRLATDTEAAEHRYNFYRDTLHQEFDQYHRSSGAALFVRVPAAPHWEIVDEDVAA